jgi:hypothetical protein
MFGGLDPDLVPGDLGAIDVVLLLVRIDLELLQYKVPRDGGSLRFEI